MLRRRGAGKPAGGRPLLTLRRIGSTLGALRLCCTNSMANRYKLRYQCISTLTGGTGTSGIGTF